MKLTISTDSRTPVFQQLVEQIHFAINAQEIAAGSRLPSIRKVASDLGIATNTVAKAYRHLEFRGVIKAQNRSGYVVAGAGGSANAGPETTNDNASSRYQARGVSADKTEVHSVVDGLEQGLFPGAFCKITEDYLGGDPDRCNIIHADGAGTKSIVAYLHYRKQVIHLYFAVSHRIPSS